MTKIEYCRLNRLATTNVMITEDHRVGRVIDVEFAVFDNDSITEGLVGHHRGAWEEKVRKKADELVALIEEELVGHFGLKKEDIDGNRNNDEHPSGGLPGGIPGGLGAELGGGGTPPRQL